MLGFTRKQWVAAFILGAGLMVALYLMIWGMYIIFGR